MSAAIQAAGRDEPSSSLRSVPISGAGQHRARGWPPTRRHNFDRHARLVEALHYLGSGQLAEAKVTQQHRSQVPLSGCRTYVPLPLTARSGPGCVVAPTLL